MSAKYGAVAAGHRLTAEAADHVLREGGNAYDAALAALAAACVTEPVLASPGGGGFLLAMPNGAPARVYDFFVQTPGRKKPAEELDFRSIEVDFGAATQGFRIGRGAAAVPGLVRGLFAVHADLGRMRLRDIIGPALGYATDGVEITDYQAYLLQVVRPILSATEESRGVFGRNDGSDELVGRGDRLCQPALADTLETLAIEGDELFYRGEIASALVRDMDQGGLIRGDDLARYRVERRAPLEIDYREARIFTNPPPSCGGLLTGFSLRLLEPLGIGALESGSAAHLGVLAEVLDLTSQARVEILAGADHDPLDETRLLDSALLERYRQQVSITLNALRGTTQISVVDAAGNLASLTVSNGEGCGYVIPGTGVMMNNMLDETDLNPGGFHRWPTDRRMTSMMAPSAVLWPDGHRVATGSGGSNRIRSAILQVFVNLLDRAMQLEEAVHAPRVHYEDGFLNVEGGFDPERIRELLQRHPEHRLWPELNMFFGGAHSVGADSGELVAIGDPRRGGEGITS